MLSITFTSHKWKTNQQLSFTIIENLLLKLERSSIFTGNKCNEEKHSDAGQCIEYIREGIKEELGRKKGEKGINISSKGIGRNTQKQQILFQISQLYPM